MKIDGQVLSEEVENYEILRLALVLEMHKRNISITDVMTHPSINLERQDVERLLRFRCIQELKQINEVVQEMATKRDYTYNYYMGMLKENNPREKRLLATVGQINDHAHPKQQSEAGPDYSILKKAGRGIKTKTAKIKG